MTDQADALAGKLARWQLHRSHSSCCPDGTCTDCAHDLAIAVTAHFAEKTAKVREELHATCQSLGCQNRARLYDQKRDANKIATLTSENERLKGDLDAYYAETRVLKEQAEDDATARDAYLKNHLTQKAEIKDLKATLARVRELMREIIGAVEFDDERLSYVVVQVERAARNEAIALLAHEGKG